MRKSAKIALAMGAVAGLICVASPAQASSITYDHDECSYSSKGSCFAIFYNSQTNGYNHSSCFVSNKSILDYSGYYDSAYGVEHEFVFADINVQMAVTQYDAYCNGGGAGQAVKNNAAFAANGESSATNTVYYNSGYAGPAQSFGPHKYGNLNSTLKNENASVKRTT